jgi:L-arabinose isomerase
MGEFNPALAAARPLLYEKEYTFSPARNPAVLACAPRPGPGTWVNLAPGPAGTFRLISCPVEILEDGTHPGIERWVRAWIRPPVPVATFLERFSQAGATHHSALLLGDHAAAMADFAAFLGLEHRPLP